jgi:hypothetical protein
VNPSNIAPCLFKHIENNLANLLCEQGWNCVSHLNILGCTRSAEEIIVWKSLQPSGLSNSQTAALQRIGVNIIVPVLGDM